MAQVYLSQYTKRAGTADIALTASYAIAAAQVNPIRLDPVKDPNPTGLLYPSSTYLFQSASNTALGYDMYIRQDGNVVKWKWVEGMLSTGLLYGGVLSYSASYLLITPGAGIIVDHNATSSAEISPVIDYVTWGPITQSIENIATAQNTFVYIDSNGSASQQNVFFAPEQYQFYIPLGKISHYDNVVTNGSSMNVQTAYDIDRQQNVFIRAFGPLKLKGVATSGQTGTLRLNIGSGTAFNLGGAYDNDPNEPSVYNVYTNNTASIIRIYRDGTGNYIFDNNGGSYYTTIEPGYYDDGTGTLATVANNDWSIQRVMVNPITGRAHVYYSQNVYGTYDEAVASISIDEFVESDATAYSYVFSAYLIVKGDTSDLTDPENKIVQAGLFRNVGGGGGTGGGGIPGGENTQIQFNNAGVFDGEPEFTFNSSTNIVTLTGSMLVSGAISASSGPTTVGFFGTASWAVSASQAISASRAFSASYALSSSRAATASFAFTSSFAISSSYASSSPNFANTNLIFTDNRNHSTNGYYYFLYNKLLGGSGTSPFDGFAVSGGFYFFDHDSNALGVGQTSTSTYKYIEITTQSIDLRFTADPASPSSYNFTNQQAYFSSSLNVTKSVYFPGLTTQPQLNIVIVDTASGQLYYTASSAIGGGGTATFSGTNTQVVFFSGSTQISGSPNITFNYTNNHFFVTGSTTLSGSTFIPGISNSIQTNVVTIDPTTGQLFYTASNSLTGVSIPLDIKDDGNPVYSNPTVLNFTGSGVSASANGTTVDIYIPGGGTSTPAPSDTFIQFNSGGLFAATGSFRFIYTSESLQHGFNTTASGYYSHAQGYFTIASGASSHAEGGNTLALGGYSHAEGSSTVALGGYSHAEGFQTLALGGYSHAEGNLTTSSGNYSHAEGFGTIALGAYQLVIGQYNVANTSQSAFIIGDGTDASNRRNVLFVSRSHFEVSASSVFLQGLPTSSELNVLVYNSASGRVYYASSSAVGSGPAPSDTFIQFNSGSKFSADQYFRYIYTSESFQHGFNTTASGLFSHAQGHSGTALGGYSHAEGYQVLALGGYSHAEGYLTTSSGQFSHAEGFNTVALGAYQLTVGQYNVANISQSAFIIGDGTADNARHNLLFASQSWFEVSASNVFLQGLTNTAKTNVVTIDTTTGQLFYTASSAIGGGGSGTPTPPATPLNSIQFNSASAFGGSAAFTFISASSTVILTGSLNISGSITGSLSGSVFIAKNETEDEYLPIVFAYSESISGDKQLQLDPGFHYNPYINAIYVPSQGAFVAGYTTIQSKRLLFSGSGHTITGSVDWSGSIDLIGSSTVTGSTSILGTSSINGIALIGTSSAYALYTTAKITTVSGLNTIYSIQTASYDGAFFDYTLISGLNARAGQIISIWSGSQIRYTETTTTDIGSTSEFIFSVALTAGSASLQVTGSTGAVIKTIIKSI